MRVSPIINNSYNPNVCKKNASLTSFRGVDEVNIQKPQKQQATFLQKIAASSIQKESDKCVKLSERALEDAEFVKQDADVLLQEASEVLKRAFELAEKNKDVFQSAKNNGVKVLILSNEDEEGENKNEQFMFDVETRALISCSKNPTFKLGCTSTEKHFEFENGNLSDCYINYVANRVGFDTYKKALERYSFMEGKLSQYYSSYDGVPGSKISADKVLLFDQNGSLQHYIQGLWLDLKGETDATKMQIFFDGEKIARCYKAIFRNNNNGEFETKKAFEYLDGQLEKALKNAQFAGDKLLSSEQAFSFKDEKVFSCTTNQGTENEAVTYFET